MPFAFGYAVAPPNTRPNISSAESTQRGWSIAVVPSLSMLGTNRTTRTRLRPPPRAVRRLPGSLVRFSATHDQYRSLESTAQRVGIDDSEPGTVRRHGD